MPELHAEAEVPLSLPLCMQLVMLGFLRMADQPHLLQRCNSEADYMPL